MVARRWENCLHYRLRVVKVIVVPSVLEGEGLILGIFLQHVRLTETLTFSAYGSRLGASVAVLTSINALHAGLNLTDCQLESFVSLIEGHSEVANRLVVVESSLQEEKSLEEEDIACGGQTADRSALCIQEGA